MNLEEILSRFGNAEYSPKFWESVNKRMKEESDAYEKAEQQDMILRHKQLTKQFTI